MGPTGSGKSALALALSERFPSRSSAWIPRRCIAAWTSGRRSPTRRRARECAHHLIDILDPVDAYSAARFRSDAIEAIAAIRSRGAVPLLVGGTMLYFKALLEGLSALPAADPAVRARLDARAADEGWPALHAELARVDPVTAGRLKRTDAQRIQRALEVHEIARQAAVRAAGLARSRRRAGTDDRDRAHSGGSRRACIGRSPIASTRCSTAGLVAEVAALRARHALTPDMPSMRCVGYRQAWRFWTGASMPRRCARPRSPRRASWPSASSRGSARRRRWPSNRRRRDLADTRGGLPFARRAAAVPDSAIAAVQ